MSNSRLQNRRFKFIEPVTFSDDFEVTYNPQKDLMVIKSNGVEHIARPTPTPTPKDSSNVNKCWCKNEGQDDGERTCWVHHDCSDGSCTHQETI